MKRTLSLLAIFCVFGLTTGSFVQSAPISHENNLVAAGPTTLEGTLMKVEGDFYVIMDSAGKERRVHVDRSTAMIGKIQPGSKVKAEVTSDGHASALKKLGN